MNEWKTQLGQSVIIKSALSGWNGKEGTFKRYLEECVEVNFEDGNGGSVTIEFLPEQVQVL